MRQMAWAGEGYKGHNKPSTLSQTFVGYDPVMWTIKI